MKRNVIKPLEASSILDGLADVEPGGPDLFEAVQQQLGLKLQPKKITIQAVVVDHLDKVPTAN